MHSRSSGIAAQTRDPQSFDRFAADYDRFASLEGPAPFVVGLLPAHGGRALEVGCGSGRFTALLAGRFAEVIGIDISQPLIDIAQRERSRPNVLYRVHDLRVFDDALGFDLIFSSTTLHHIPQLASALKHLRTLLKPRGVMVLVDNVAPHPKVPR
jgi:SAM-dependent methyltransferase